MQRVSKYEMVSGNIVGKLKPLALRATVHSERRWRENYFYVHTSRNKNLTTKGVMMEMFKREKNFRQAYYEEVEAAHVARNKLREIRRELFRDRLKPLPAIFNPDVSEEDTDNEMPGLESDSEINSRSQEVNEAKRSRPE